MIIKVIADFLNVDNFSDILEELNENKYETLYKNDCLYVSNSNNILKETNEEFNNLIKRKINIENIFIKEITENNLSKEDSIVIDWCKNQFIKQDIIRYEDDNQQKIHTLLNMLDGIEAELCKISPITSA